jgi:hypothetical protein
MKDLASNYLAEKREAEEDYLDNQELSLDEVFFNHSNQYKQEIKYFLSRSCTSRDWI